MGPLGLLLFLLFLLSRVGVSAIKTVLFGYLPEWRYSGADFETLCESYSHIAFFSGEPGPEGNIWGLDRLPSGAALADARAAAARHGCELIICFGGNGRSTHFSSVVRSAQRRRSFVAAVSALVNDLGFSGVDYNWEYPGFQFGSGYASDAEAKADYRGLRLLVKQTRQALKPNATITMAYYPDGKQEEALVAGGFAQQVDYFHAMTYDAQGPQHSSMELAQRAIAGAGAAGLPLSQITLGVPFYGRSAKTGDWTTYEDLGQRQAPLAAGTDSVVDDKGDVIGFNGRAMIAEKTRLALRQGLAGVMVWEAGQDCRQRAVTRDGRTHAVTCPDGTSSSLLSALLKASEEFQPLIHSKEL